jgi:hypothetical protein
MSMRSLPIFPLILTLLDFGAAIEAGFRRERNAVVYWLAAAVLTWTVMQMQRGAR